MKDRRQFLKEAAAGAVMMSSSGRWGIAALGVANGPGGKSRVVIARDPKLHGAGNQPDEKHVLDLLDRAMAAYTGYDKPVEAWRSMVPMDKVIGLKVNGLGGRGIATSPVLILAVAERLQQAGVKPGNILVWDQNARFVENFGLTLSNAPGKLRCTTAEAAGFEDQESSFGVARIRVTKILTRECAMVINLPILKDHGMSGVTFALKNMYGSVDRPYSLHANNCSPAVADLNSIPVYRDKIRLTIGDAMSSVYNGGPGYRPEHIWYPNAILVGEDRVALDTIAWQMLEQKRAAAGLRTLQADGREPRYIAVAADASHRLGTNDPRRIHRVEI